MGVMVARCAAVLAVLLAVAGCTAPGHGATAASSSHSVPTSGNPAPVSGHPVSSHPVSSAPALGEVGCHPPSPLSVSPIGVGEQIQGTGHGAQLWGCSLGHSKLAGERP